jgi:cytochrome bd ubiquinol oxidase subunit I
MELSALLLSRLQWAFTMSFHIIFPSFTIGLAAWLTVLEALHLATGRAVYRLVFEFWLKIFGVAFGLGVVSGIVMAFQFGTNWSELSRMSGPIQGILLSYETFTGFALEASFFGILLFGRSRLTFRRSKVQFLSNFGGALVGVRDRVEPRSRRAVRSRAPKPS